MHNSLVRSVLEYHSVIWVSNKKFHQNVVDRIQNKFLRYSYYKEYKIWSYNTSPSFQRENYIVESLSFRRQKASPIFLFEIINNKIDMPKILASLFSLSFCSCSPSTQHVFCTQNQNLLCEKFPYYCNMSTV